MYYRLQMVGADHGAAFEDEAVAEGVCEMFNTRYASEYEVVEDEDPTNEDIAQALTIKTLEDL